MTTFISGSRSIENLDENVKQMLFDEMDNNCKIVVGDANGVDAKVQSFFNNEGYKEVVVYAINKPRNNIGDFKVELINAGGSMFYVDRYTAKDAAMTDVCDKGIVIWNGTSKGSLNNIKRLLKQNKPCLVYLTTDNKTYKIENEQDIKNIGKATQLTF